VIPYFKNSLDFSSYKFDRYAYASSELIKFLTGLIAAAPYYRVYVFSTGVAEITSGRTLGNAANIDATKSNLEQVSAAGLTNIYGVLDRVLGDNPNATVFRMMTDGYATWGDTNTTDILNLIEAY